jgi:cation transport regulator ChaC
MLKSTIDWNEIIPLLPKAKREELYLEAVMILSAPGPKEPTHRSGAFSRGKGLRVWQDQKQHAGCLSQPGRLYKINRSQSALEIKGVLGQVWNELKVKKSDSTSHAEFKVLCGEKKAAQTIAYLWSRNLIEVVTP